MRTPAFAGVKCECVADAHPPLLGKPRAADGAKACGSSSSAGSSVGGERGRCEGVASSHDARGPHRASAAEPWALRRPGADPAWAARSRSRGAALWRPSRPAGGARATSARATSARAPGPAATSGVAALVPLAPLAPRAAPALAVRAPALAPPIASARFLELGAVRLASKRGQAQAKRDTSWCAMSIGSELHMYALGSQCRMCARFLRGPAALTSTTIRLVGTVGSSYATGVVAGLTECSKKAVTHSIVDAEEARLRDLLTAAMHTGHGRPLLLGLHGMGCRVAVTDACFLSMHAYLSSELHWPARSSFAMSAVSGILGKVLLDAALSGSMTPSRSPSELLRGTAAALRSAARAPRGTCAAPPGVRCGCRVLVARVLEFVIGYFGTAVVTDVLASMSELGQ